MPSLIRLLTGRAEFLNGFCAGFRANIPGNTTSMAIDELIAVVPPPPAPFEAGPAERRPEVERALGVVLPDDVCEVGLHYGSGMFAGELEVFNPFSVKYLEQVEMVSACYRQLKQAEDEEAIPYDIFPKAHGLLPWGVTGNGHVMFWVTRGEANQWLTVLLRSGEMDFQELHAPITSFLARVFVGPMPCVLWEVEWQVENFVGKAFQPLGPSEL
jgi:hypothetical protein